MDSLRRRTGLVHCGAIFLHPSGASWVRWFRPWGCHPIRRHGSPSGSGHSGAKSSGLGPCRLTVSPSLPPLSSGTVTSAAAREGTEAMAAAGFTIPTKRIDSSTVVMVVGSILVATGANPSTVGVGRIPHASEGGGQSSEVPRKRGRPKVSRYVLTPLTPPKLGCHPQYDTKGVGTKICKCPSKINMKSATAQIIPM
jgi:hypothetical protein